MPPLPTIRDVIDVALYDAGIVGEGQTASGAQIERAFHRANWMIAQWQVKRFLVYGLDTFSVTSTGALSYSVGHGGDIDVSVRPDKIESAFLRQLTPGSPNQVDYPLGLLLSRDDYNNISMKQLGSFPQYLWYDNAWPLGYIYPWPVPQSALYATFVSFKRVIPQFENLSDDVALPNEYFNALKFNLAVELRDSANLPPKPVAVQLAKNSLNTLRNANAQVPRARMPAELVRPGVYNPYADQYR